MLDDKSPTSANLGNDHVFINIEYWPIKSKFGLIQVSFTNNIAISY